VPFGASSFYLSNYKKGALQLTLCLVGFIMMIVGTVMYTYGMLDIVYGDLATMFVIGVLLTIVGSFLFTGIHIWELVDGIRILCSAVNEDANGIPLVWNND
jgi:uncharacterized membrane protein